MRKRGYEEIIVEWYTVCTGNQLLYNMQMKVVRQTLFDTRRCGSFERMDDGGARKSAIRCRNNGTPATRRSLQNGELQLHLATRANGLANNLLHVLYDIVGTAVGYL